MRSRPLLSTVFVFLLVFAFAGPAKAQTCLISILCPPKTLPAPPPVPAPPSPPALPPTDSITQPVTDTVDSAGGSLKTPAPVLEGQMLTLINADRAAAGLGALQMSGWAQSFARAFSEKMMAAGSIWHNPEYFAKGRAAMGATLLSENVGYDSSIRANHLGFMSSPSHRANILDGRLTHVGVGVAVGPSGRIYVTEDFARIPGAAAPRGKEGQGGTQAATGLQKKGGAVPVAFAAAGGISSSDTERVRTITLPAQAKSPRPAAEESAERSVVLAEAMAAGSRSAAPMLPGLVAGALLAVLAPVWLLGRRLILSWGPGPGEIS